MAIKNDNLSPKANSLRIRLVLLFVITQVTSIAASYFLTNLLLKPSPSNQNTRLMLMIIFYSVFVFVGAIWVIRQAFKPLATVEHYFSARKAGITISNNLVHESISEKLINDILTMEPGAGAIINKPATKSQNTPASSLVAQAFEQSPTAIVGLNEQNQPVLANKASFVLFGVAQDDLDTLSKQLAAMKFSQNISLVKWIAESEKAKIHASDVWSRVDLRVIENEQEVIKKFDVIASYEKNSALEIDTILIIVDRTADYSEDDKAMDLIAVAAHELRGPITVLRGLIDVFERELGPNLNDDQRQLLTRMEVSAKQLTNYVGNILNVAHIDRDSYETSLHQEDWLKLLTQICKNVNPQVQARNRKLQLRLPSQLPPVMADRVGIEHVLTNLIDNATKYSRDGGIITVGTRLVPTNNTIETTVQDTGIGIPESLMGNLFTKFYRSHRSKKAIGGSGIGLFLCKTIVNANGGEIWVKSQEGKGTTVGFTVPLYQKVANGVQTNDNENITRESHGWIKNHSLYRR